MIPLSVPEISSCDSFCDEAMMIITKYLLQTHNFATLLGTPIIYSNSKKKKKRLLVLASTYVPYPIRNWQLEISVCKFLYFSVCFSK